MQMAELKRLQVELAELACLSESVLTLTFGGELWESVGYGRYTGIEEPSRTVCQEAT